MAARKKRLTKPEVIALIAQIKGEKEISDEILLSFAEKVNGGPFLSPKPKKPKAMTMAAAKKAVLSNFGCKTVTELRKNKNFTMSMTGETIALKSKADWMKLYRRWIGVPPEERDQTGSNCINGINVLENFRPWHVFGLDSKTASKDDVKNAFRDLAKIHHPDVGGDKQVFERIQKMRDSLLALMK
jgi:hypothetical protein